MIAADIGEAPHVASEQRIAVGEDRQLLEESRAPLLIAGKQLKNGRENVKTKESGR